MPVKVFITIDTEEDCWGKYSCTDNPVTNIFRLPILQDLFDQYGAIPTYLINYPVVKSEKASAVLQGIYDSGRCEIATHCHPWNTPPFEEEVNPYNSMSCNLPEELIMKKLEVLHEKIGHRFKVTPACFRSGRYAFSPSLARSIHKLGYKVDTSVTPFLDWSGDHGPNFIDFSAQSYYFDPDDILRDREDGALFEVTPSIGFFQKNAILCNSVRKSLLRKPFSWLHFSGILDRMHLLNLRWLSPEESTGSDIISLSKRFLERRHPFLNMSFHSTNLLPGKGPFVNNQQELDGFLQRIEMFLRFAVERGLTFAPLSAALEVDNADDRRLA